MQLFYDYRVSERDLLRMAVHAQLPVEQGGLSSPSIIIDSSNILKIDQLTDICYDLNLQFQTAIDNTVRGERSEGLCSLSSNTSSTSASHWVTTSAELHG